MPTRWLAGLPMEHWPGPQVKVTCSGVHHAKDKTEYKTRNLGCSPLTLTVINAILWDDTRGYDDPY